MRSVRRASGLVQTPICLRSGTWPDMRPGQSTGDRTRLFCWWAHSELTSINIEPTFQIKNFEDSRGDSARTESSVGMGFVSAARPAGEPATLRLTAKDGEAVAGHRNLARSVARRAIVAATRCGSYG
jgi:hypothetical protein